MKDSIEEFENLFSSAYKNRRVLVLGHTGFKGSWLSLWLKMLGAEVTGFAKYIPTEPSHFEALELHNLVQDVRGDICNHQELEAVFQRCKPEIVFHLAAQPIVSTSYSSPKETFDTNLGGTLNALECIRHCNSVKSAVIITSDKCYENIGIEEGYKETDRLGGADPYSASKACAEIAFSSYFRSFFDASHMPNIATTRAGNVIGGGDWADDRIVPDCVRAFSCNESVEIRRPDATRPWQHVLEPLSGYLWLGAKLLQNHQQLNGESYNFGPRDDDVKAVGELVDLFQQHWGKGEWAQNAPPEGLKEASLLQLSCEKARSQLDWMPVLGFEDTIMFTADWYIKYYSGNENPVDLTASQIIDYVYRANELELDWAALSASQCLKAS